MEFRYHPDILNRFPDLVGGIALVRGITNSPTPPELLHTYEQEQQIVKQKIGSTPLSELASLAAWRQAFRSFGVDPTGYRSASEALLRRLTKKGDIPSLNALVDLCNLISIRYALPVAAIDMREVSGAITVCFANGSEHFLPLGANEIENPSPGEVIFIDEKGMVVARRWCWRQSAESAVGLATRQAIITIEAHHASGRMDVKSALDDLLEFLARYTGGEIQTGLLGPEHPSLRWQDG
jgi:DNA/RNA-binding domain of Phe-tRNA-synthetase-like protein